MGSTIEGRLLKGTPGEGSERSWPVGVQPLGRDSQVEFREPRRSGSCAAVGCCGTSVLCEPTQFIRWPQHSHPVSGAYSKGHVEITSLESGANTVSETGQSRWCVMSQQVSKAAGTVSDPKIGLPLSLLITLSFLGEVP